MSAFEREVAGSEDTTPSPEWTHGSQACRRDWASRLKACSISNSCSSDLNDQTLMVLAEEPIDSCDHQMRPSQNEGKGACPDRVSAASRRSTEEGTLEVFFRSDLVSSEPKEGHLNQ